MTQSRGQVPQLFLSGVNAIASVTNEFAEEDWERPACGWWTARQTATHLLGVVGWYHQWLDRAIEGAQTRPFPESEIDERAERDVEHFADLSGPDAVQRFRARAFEYVTRTTGNWNIDATTPPTTTTASAPTSTTTSSESSTKE